MEYNEMYQKSPIIKVDGQIWVPPGYKGETNIIIPNSIVQYCINKYALNRSGIKGLDPMCGTGTIPRVINSQRGNCMGVEIDSQAFKTALVASDGQSFLFGDFTSLDLPVNSFDYIFTSMPFVWFGDPNSKTPVNPVYANTFKKLLTVNGFILLDSVPMAVRNRSSREVAQLQSEYLAQNGFHIKEVLTFDGTERSVIIKLCLDEYE